LEKLFNFINGEYVPPVNDSYIENFNPSYGRPYSLIPDSDNEDIDLAVKSAKEAFTKWSETTAQERADFLYNIADAIEKRKNEFAEAESRDQGKPLSLSLIVDIPRAIYNFRFFAGAILHHEEKSTNLNNIALNYSTRKPLGVAGLISPWNLPLYLLTWKIAPALATGNTAVCKPSEFTSFTASMLGDVFKSVGLPKGVCNIVLGTGPKAGESLVSHPDVPLISFTGGTETGKKIIISSAPYFKKLSLELGGKNPNIIFDDADFDECIPVTVRSSFQNQGEICLCGSRIFVHKNIYEKFLERFVNETQKLIVGNPFSEKTNLGPLISKNHLEKVKYYINLAREEGGSIVNGGNTPELDSELKNGYFLEPTIITGLNNDCRTMQEEIFGPVVTIASFSSEEEVISYANSTKYGLSASIWTNDLKRAHRVAESINTGTVWINTWMLRDLRVPFGGNKFSGLGREGGEYSIDFYTELKNICIKYK
jgi:aminomuconate-semialdehyde/2-hydroxymuconate-6-semialdehyde dehydrogenase